MRILLLALLAFVTGCSGCATTQDVQHSAALRLEFADGLCSGTAVAADEIVSAAHCFGGVLESINGEPVTGYRLVSRKDDVVRIHVDGPRFKVWARKFGKAVQGDRVSWHGNPLGAPDMLREGYVSGIVDGLYVIAAATCVGDSGPGIFNERGELVAVVSKIPTPKCSPFVLAVPV